MKRYEIQDNGGQPFIVQVGPKSVVIFKQTWNDDLKGLNPPEKIFNLPYTKIWIGNKSKFQYPGNWLPKFVGNSILIQQSKTQYVYIGESIKQFSLRDDSIQEYFSDMGNSGVPQPFAIGKKNVYFFIDMTPSGISAVPKSALDLSNDLQEQLWEKMANGTRKLDPIKKEIQVKVLQYRLY